MDATRAGGLAVGLVLAVAVSTEAQVELADVTGLDCSFSTVVSGTWNDGIAEASHDGVTLSLRFEEIDPDGATAEIVGPYGDSQIIVRQTGDYLHLVQMFLMNQRNLLNLLILLNQ